jgi:hypothetical protein
MINLIVGYSHRQTTVEEETQLCYPSPYPHPYPGPSDAYDYSQYRLQSSDECSYEGRGHGVVPVRKKTWIERREIVRSMRYVAVEIIINSSSIFSSPFVLKSIRAARRVGIKSIHCEIRR